MYSCSLVIFILFSFSFSVSVGALWEVFRYTLYNISVYTLGDFDMSYAPRGLVFTILGAAIVSIVGYVDMAYVDSILANNINAKPGDLDSTFGTNGIVLYDDPITISNEEGRATAIQPDGKIVVTGYITTRISRRNAVLVLRYNRDGSLDNAFGTNGVVIYSGCEACLGEGHAVAIQPDGKILVVGYSEYLKLKPTVDFAHNIEEHTSKNSFDKLPQLFEEIIGNSNN